MEAASAADDRADGGGGANGEGGGADGDRIGQADAGGSGSIS